MRYSPRSPSFAGFYSGAGSVAPADAILPDCLPADHFQSYAHSSLWCRAVAFAEWENARRNLAPANAPACPDCGGLGYLPNPEWNGRDRLGEFAGPECPRCAAEWDEIKAEEDHAFEQRWIGGDPARRAAL